MAKKVVRCIPYKIVRNRGERSLQFSRYVLLYIDGGWHSFLDLSRDRSLNPLGISRGSIRYRFNSGCLLEELFLSSSDYRSARSKRLPVVAEPVVADKAVTSVFSSNDLPIGFRVYLLNAAFSIFPVECNHA